MSGLVRSCHRHSKILPKIGIIISQKSHRLEIRLTKQIHVMAMQSLHNFHCFHYYYFSLNLKFRQIFDLSLKNQICFTCYTIWAKKAWKYFLLEQNVSRIYLSKGLYQGHFYLLCRCFKSRYLNHYTYSYIIYYVQLAYFPYFERLLMFFISVFNAYTSSWHWYAIIFCDPYICFCDVAESTVGITTVRDYSCNIYDNKICGDLETWIKSYCTFWNTVSTYVSLRQQNKWLKFFLSCNFFHDIY